MILLPTIEPPLEIQESQIANPRDPSILLFFTLAILPQCFDFRTETGGGNAIQLLILSSHMFLFLSFIFVYGISLGRSATPTICATIAFILVGTATGLFYDQEFTTLITIAIPTMLFLTGFILTYSALRMIDDIRSLYNRLVFLCLVTMVSFASIEIASQGLDLSRSRYEILGGAITESISLLFVGLFFGFNLAEAITTILALSLTFMSVTRVYLLQMAFQIASCILVYPRMLLRKSVIIGTIMLSLLSISAFVVNNMMALGVLERWTQRLFVSERSQGGLDVTSLTRIAEVNAMRDATFKSDETMLFGNGFAAITQMTGEEAGEVTVLIGEENGELHSVGFGHHNFWSMLFIAGLLGGGPLVLILFISAIRALFLVYRVLWMGETDAPARVAVWGAFSIIGLTIYGLYAGPMGNRGSALWYGISLAMLYWGCDLFQPVRRDQLRTRLGTNIQ